MITYRPRPRTVTKPTDATPADPKLLASSGLRVAVASVLVENLGATQ